ncbi:hypothetical protein D9M72_479670 [compost metagenome]
MRVLTVLGDLGPVRLALFAVLQGGEMEGRAGGVGKLDGEDQGVPELRVQGCLGGVNDLAGPLGDGGTVRQLFRFRQLLHDLFHGPVRVHRGLGVVEFLGQRDGHLGGAGVVAAVRDAEGEQCVGVGVGLIRRDTYVRGGSRDAGQHECCGAAGHCRCGEGTAEGQG